MLSDYGMAEAGFNGDFERRDLMICTCCRLVAANGECGCESHDHEPLSVAGGIVINTDDEYGFVDWRSCDGCGDPLAGDRFGAVILY